ncbi:nuclear transport factor 2 family protein [Comamonadaceae bacterium G21597-S1]|nr:nuclear transport factor 2 family protein [Comamonadaceae bacterium G21597-S1]
MDRETARAIEWDCTRVLLRFYDCFDRWDYAAMVAFYAPDGLWHRAGQDLRGRAAILNALAQRARTQTVRHVLTNILVTPLDATHAEASCYVTAYRHDDGKPAVKPPIIAMPALLVQVAAQLTQVQEEWLISCQRTQRVFEFGAGS